MPTEEPLNTNSTIQKAIKSIIIDIATQYQVIDDRKEAIREIIVETSKKYNISKKVLTKMAKTCYKGNFDDVSSENDEFIDAYMAIMGEQPRSDK